MPRISWAGRVAATGAVVLVITIAAVVGGGGGSGWTQDADVPTTANVWIDVDGGTCTLNGTPAAYSDASACTYSGAEAHFAPGRTVGMKGGTYSGNWLIDRVAALDNLTPGCDPYGEWGTASTTNCLRVFVASGETVTGLGNIEIDSSGIWIDGERQNVSTWPNTSPTYNFVVNGSVGILSGSASFSTDHSIIDGVDAMAIYSLGTQQTLIRRTDSGGRFVSGADPPCNYTDEFGTVPGDIIESRIADRNGWDVVDVVFDSIYFHDVDRTSGGCHEGGLFLVNGSNLEIRNSVWSQTWVYAIQIQNFNAGGLPSDVTIENNWFGCDVEATGTVGNRTTCSGQDAIQFDSDGTAFTNYLIRFNSFGGSSGSLGCYTPTCTFTNVRVIGNTGELPTNDGSDVDMCGVAGITYDDNGWNSGTCGVGDTDIEVLSSIFTSITVGAENLHLLNATNGANNLVTTGTGDYAIATDIDGQARPIGANRDAGADER